MGATVSVRKAKDWVIVWTVALMTAWAASLVISGLSAAEMVLPTAETAKR